MNQRSFIDPAEFRRILGHLPTGVVIITALVDGQPVGMSCNSFTSVSIDPPLVGVFPAKSSTTWPQIRESGRFCVNIAARHHEDLSRSFARRGEDRFSGVPWTPRVSGPGLTDAVAWIDCEIHEEVDAGDHSLVLGLVVGMDAQEGQEPILFHKGVYGYFEPLAH